MSERQETYEGQQVGKSDRDGDFLLFSQPVSRSHARVVVSQSEMTVHTPPETERSSPALH